MGAESVTVCFTGNPNCGKTTLFNAYTGAGKKTANWPGVTVALSEGSLMHRGRLVHREFTAWIPILWKKQ